MKNFVMGFLVCAMLLASGQAFGSSISSVGKKVSSELVVDLNGNEIGTGVVISNKTYLPVREVANAFGADIKLKEGGVSLTFEAGVDTVAIESQREVDLYVLKKQKEKLEKQISEIPGTIEYYEKTRIPQVEEQLKMAATESQKDGVQETIDSYKKIVDDAKTSLPQLEQELAEVVQKIAELEEQ